MKNFINYVFCIVFFSSVAFFHLRFCSDIEKDKEIINEVDEIAEDSADIVTHVGNLENILGEK